MSLRLENCINYEKPPGITVTSDGKLIIDAGPKDSLEITLQEIIEKFREFEEMVMELYYGPNGPNFKETEENLRELGTLT